MAANRTLQGVYFEVARRPVKDSLPRMDIAAFVGFAEKGPLHIPVTIEDVAHYRMIFGGTVLLAWNSYEKRYEYSRLALAVEHFFRNGGQRCRVVRVAHEHEPDSEIHGARYQRFTAPNLYAMSPHGPQAVELKARSAGSWADGLRVGTRLRSYGLGMRDTTPGTKAFVARMDSYSLLVRATPSDLRINDLIEVRFGDAGLRVFLFVDKLEDEESERKINARTGLWFGEVPASPDDGGLPVALSQSEGLHEYATLSMSSPVRAMTVRRLRMDLLVWEGDAFADELNNLAFHPHHPRFWGKLPDDETLFGMSARPEEPTFGAGLETPIPEAVEPRFPLAAIRSIDMHEHSLSLPLGMRTRISPDDGSPAVGDMTTPACVRNGLDRFGADLFLDKNVADSSRQTLRAQAFHRRYVEGKPLKGIHTLLHDSLVSMISVPDCCHCQWDTTPSPFESPMQAPGPLSLSSPDRHGRRTLRWSPVADVRRYVVQSSDNARFTPFKERFIEKPNRLDLRERAGEGDEAETYCRFLLEPRRTTSYFFRVRAEGYGRTSPWSNTLYARLPETAFDECEIRSADRYAVHLEVEMVSPADIRTLLGWRLTGHGYSPGAFSGEFELQQARDMMFVSGRVIYRGIRTDINLPEQFDEPAYFRVRAVYGSSVGPWSNTVVVLPHLLSRRTMNDISEYDDGDILAVHRALIRLCSIDGDKVAVLSLPRHYRAEQVAAHADGLLPSGGWRARITSTGVGGGDRMRVPPLNGGERRALSYAALFHPWVYLYTSHTIPGPGEAHVVPTCPPDGAACGRMAATSIKRGAWIASANKPIVDCVGLTSHFSEESLVDLINKRVNMLGVRAGNRMVTAWDTLSRDAEFRSLSVR
ncbi:MAG: hypothetical protein GF344_12720, partial [Chitinivibrionales bacterium]|nr:hypothetical protein [Chitinivibrionales bacterium]MBD3357606.1 hypothetical protein [Chitinivibrionales bacterium]